MHLRHDARSAPSREGRAQRTSLHNAPFEHLPPASLKREVGCSTLSIPLRCEQCLREIDTFHRGAPCLDTFCVELVRRATLQKDQEAWAWMHHCFGGVLRHWLRGHPLREAACRLESEEYYVALAFERFWQATTLSQQMQFSTLGAVLRYLHASLNGAIVDMLRAYAWPREISLPESGEPHREDVTSSREIWSLLTTLLSNPRERRLAYLLFHCGLGPREIVQCCPQEFSDIREVYCLRRHIMERVSRNTDLLNGDSANRVQEKQEHTILSSHDQGR